ncbi:Tex family protein, partial [candidate division KSB1 bacterium]
AIRDRLNQLKELDKRREAILKSLEERDLLTDELNEKLLAAETMVVLEDIYLPYRPKRRTRATIAREKGLEPLAERIFEQSNIDVIDEAESFIDPEKDVNTIEDALDGARDIIAEWINEDEIARSKMRELYINKAVIYSKVIKGKEDAGKKYMDYFECADPAKNAKSHRILAMRRGENEEFLTLRFIPENEDATILLEDIFVKAENESSGQVKLAIQDCYKRLLSPSMETEIRLLTKKSADEEAILVFADNLKNLLLASPMGEKSVMAVDPGFRTGCKVVCLDKQGKLLEYDTIFPHKSDNEAETAKNKVTELCKKHNIEVIAVGNGTAGRETEAFLRNIGIKNVPIVMVNESGASIYSASEVAREEFPDHDVTVRGSVSIGRRLMDPLSELVKIDPKSIGVGQYQHDVDQNLLKQSLDDVVISCVNNVGVDVNIASKQLLTYVSGLGPKLAQKIIDHRNDNGPFENRKKLKKVSGLGPKAFEQAAGFLRINNGKNPLDASAVHPESYPIVDKMVSDLKCSVGDLLKDPQLRKKIEINKYVTDTTGIPTLTDIMLELEKPGRDPREKFEIFNFAEDVNKPEDLTIGMKLPGIVTNVTRFGAFVDIGVHQDGLIHISQLADKFVKDPAEIVKVNQKVTVTVVDLDLDRNRISLSLRKNPEL